MGLVDRASANGYCSYYLDFCEKYRHEALDRESLQVFLLKLASKNQSTAQQTQATRSVRLYLELAAPGWGASIGKGEVQSHLRVPYGFRPGLGCKDALREAQSALDVGWTSGNACACAASALQPMRKSASP
jgi:hypothetical protein